MIFIRAEELGKNYGRGDNEVSALQGFSFAVDAGQFVAVMGPSGSGKSTLLSVLGALNTPSGGLYEVDDLDVYALTPDQRSDFRREYIGFVFQNFLLVPYLTLAENVMLPLVTKKMKTGAKRTLAEEALARVGLSGKGGRLPGQVSGGEQERAALARAVVNRPPLLLADEPTGNLDLETGRRIMELIRSLGDQGVTIIMVTHDPKWAEYADRVLHMADGRLAADVSQHRPLRAIG